MFILKAVFCRMIQGGFRIAIPVLPYTNPTIVGECKGIAEILRKEKVNSVLVVTDKGIRNNGLVLPVEEVIKLCNVKYVIYDGTNPNPTVDNVEEAVSMYHENNCDCIIAIGGGSSMDCAKAAGARIAYPKRSLKSLGGPIKVWRKIPTLIAIPTTAGTGSETTVAALVTDSKTHHKYALMSFPLIPKYAVLDAVLTYSLPKHLTSTTGMDALTHAVEAYIGRSATKETKRLALEATKLIFENVEEAYLDGQNHEARKNMLHAAYKAGIAFSKSYVGYIHAVAHSLGGMYGTPHGLANAVIMPYVLEAYGPCVYKKLYELGIAAGVCSENDSKEEGAKKFIKAIKNLNTKMCISDKIEDIREEDIPFMAAFAEKEANPLYPVPKLMTRKELEVFYHQIRR